MLFNQPLRYKELCEQFNEQPKSGGALTNQLTNFRRNYQIDKVDKKYIIVRELDKLEKIEMSKYSKHKEYIEPMLYTILSNCDYNVLRVNAKQLIKILKLVNEDYYYAKYNTEKVDIKLTGSDTSGLRTFMSETEPMYKKIIKDVLEDMCERQLIEINLIPMFSKRYVDDKTSKVYTMTKEATKDEDIPHFLEAKRQVLKELGLNKWCELGYFQVAEAKKLVARELNIDYFYYDYEIILNKVGLKEMIMDNFEEMQISFNKYIQEKTLKKHTKAMKMLTSEEKKIYVDALIDVENDLRLREE